MLFRLQGTEEAEKSISGMRTSGYRLVLKRKKKKVNLEIGKMFLLVRGGTFSGKNRGQKDA